MSPDTNKPPAGKDETQSRKTPTAAAKPQEPALKCPRCDSANTKFCYYNNYSLTQPRHFCKTCRRYWTKGGALRNVPIGGGCRKNKKMKSSPRLSGGDSRADDSSGSSELGGLKFFQGISPAMDFQLNFPPNTGLLNQFSHFDNSSNTCGAITSNPSFTLDPSAGTSSSLMGLGFPFFQEMGSLNCHSSLTSSIESLSSINQDLHWKLQRQRLAMLFVGDNNNQKENNNLTSIEQQTQIPQKPQPILFQNLEIPKPSESSCGIINGSPRKYGGGNTPCGNNLSTEWFFDNSYATVNPTPATSGNNNLNENNNSNWSGIQAWSDLTQYTSLP
ncbi:hypothetical protein DH2020_013792 [Rehmannia glutinosa]|uniref:Dof zinc finger protein n=1 Tax=Rehmannia glutinosa TaxID=99300 RepID=A0ABR0X3A3_REHGL